MTLGDGYIVRIPGRYPYMAERVRCGGWLVGPQRQSSAGHLAICVAQRDRSAAFKPTGKTAPGVCAQHKVGGLGSPRSGLLARLVPDGDPPPHVVGLPWTAGAWPTPFAATDPYEVCTTERNLATLCSRERWPALHKIDDVPAEIVSHGF